MINSKVVRTCRWSIRDLQTVGKSEETIPLGRSRNRWEDNIRMDFKNGVGICHVYSFGLE
jgi:hypothetical protein